MAYGNMQIQRMPAAQVPQFQQPQRPMMRQPAQRYSTGGGMNDLMAYTKNRARGGAGNRAGAPPMGRPGIQPRPQAPAGPAYDPSHPFDNLTPGMQPNGTPYQYDAIQNYLVSQAGKDGWYGGDYSKLMEPFNQAYQNDYGSGVRRAQVAGASGSMDPSQVALMSRLGQSGAAGEASRGRNQALLQLMQGRQDFNNNMLGNAINFQQNWRTNDQQGVLNRVAGGEARRGQGGFGSFLGGILGTGLGAFAGGYGGGLGNRLGGGRNQPSGRDD